MKNRYKKLHLMMPVLIIAALLTGLFGGANVVRAQENILFQDDFSTPGVWATIADPNFNIGYVNGTYQITNNFFNSFVSSALAFPGANVRIEVDANRVGGPASGYFGAVCRWQDIHNYYALVIGDNNLAGIVRVQGGVTTFIAQGSVQINAANWNRVGGDCVGNSLTLIVNGEPVLEAVDGAFATGSIGMMVGTRGAAGVTVQFDNIVVSRADVPPPVGIIPPTGPQEQLYIVQPGDTLSGLAVRFGTTVADLMARNPQIINPNLIFVGQRLAIPAQPGLPIPPTGPGVQLHIVQPGETLFGIATRFGTSVAHLLQLNPNIVNPNLIFTGQQLVVSGQPMAPIPPTGPGQHLYIVQPTDTLSALAVRFGTTVAHLLQLNPQIVNPNLIFAGQQIRVPGPPVVTPTPTPPAEPTPTPTADPTPTPPENDNNNNNNDGS